MTARYLHAMYYTNTVVVILVPITLIMPKYKLWLLLLHSLIFKIQEIHNMHISRAVYILGTVAIYQNICFF